MLILAVILLQSIPQLTAVETEPEYSSFIIFSQALECSTRVVIAPPGSGSLNSPLLLVLDGEDFFTAALAYTRYAALCGAVPEMTVAGVSCPDRFAFYTPTTADIPDGTPVPGSGEAQRYLEFISSELLPALHSEYSTAPYTVVFGHSLAGLFVLYAMEQEDCPFSGFIASSPSLWWDSEYVTRHFSADALQGRRVFVSLGGEDSTMSAPVSAFLEKAPSAVHQVFPGVSHQLVPFRSLPAGMEYIFAPWASGEFDSAPDVRSHYDEMSVIYGYSVLPPEPVLNRMGYRFISGGNYAEALQAFMLNAEYHSRSSNVHDSLGECLLLMEDTTGSVENYRLSLELDSMNLNAEQVLEELGAL